MDRITYLRDVDHCNASNRIKESTIKSITNAENSDNLEIIRFEENGWQVISRKGFYHVGQKVMFLPPDSVLPKELLDLTEVGKYTDNGRIRVTKLRGNRSEGLILNAEIVKPFIPHILLWDDPPSEHMKGNCIKKNLISVDMETFISIDRLQNIPNFFERGELISITEKIHGANIRIGKLRSPIDDSLITPYVGSHDAVFSWENNENNLFVNAGKKYIDRIPDHYLLYGELFGPGIQKKYHYGLKKPDVLFYSASRKGIHLLPQEFELLCKKCNIPIISSISMTYVDDHSMKELIEMADSPSLITKAHDREGIVIKSMKYRAKMAKVIGVNYMTGRKTTERH